MTLNEYIELTPVIVMLIKAVLIVVLIIGIVSVYRSYRKRKDDDADQGLVWFGFMMLIIFTIPASKIYSFYKEIDVSEYEQLTDMLKSGAITSDDITSNFINPNRIYSIEFDAFMAELDSENNIKNTKAIKQEFSEALHSKATVNTNKAD